MRLLLRVQRNGARALVHNTLFLSLSARAKDRVGAHVSCVGTVATPCACRATHVCSLGRPGTSPACDSREFLGAPNRSHSLRRQRAPKSTASCSSTNRLKQVNKAAQFTGSNEPRPSFCVCQPSHEVFLNVLWCSKLICLLFEASLSKAPCSRHDIPTSHQQGLALETRGHI